MKVEAPKGHHWMQTSKTFKLMQDSKEGYKAHKGSTKTANFKVGKNK